MRNRYDAFAKELLLALVNLCGVAQSHAEIHSETLYLDIRYTPLSPPPPSLGIFSKMLVEPSILEFYHDTPTPKEWRDCQLKQLIFYNNACTLAKREDRPLPSPPLLWVLSAG